MIDIHHHCIPGVDDGPRDLAQAVELCLAAAADGITTIIATPHVLRGAWQNRSRDLLETSLAALRNEVGDRVELVLGSEYFFDFDMVEVLTTENAIVPLAGSRYVLVEFDAHSVPPLVDAPFYRAQLAGWIPIVAHPERNTVFQAKPSLLRLLVSRGARMQVTAGSLLGDFGDDARKCAARWIGEGLVHFVATDAHNVKRRPPRLSAARAVLRQIAGDEVADALVLENPRAVLERRQLAWDPEPAPPAPEHGFIGSLRRFIKSR